MKKIASIFLGIALIFGLTSARSFADDSRYPTKSKAGKKTATPKKTTAKKSTAKS